jgi:hypothetical protein
VRRYDQAGVFGNGAAFNEPWVFVDYRRQAGRTACHGKTIIGGRRNHADNLDTVGPKRFQH